MKLYTRVAILLGSTLALVTGLARADCAFYDIRCAASEAGREAAEKVAKELPEVGFKTVNYWGYILEMYHTGDANQKAWATKLIRGELGIDPNATTTTDRFEIALTFGGFDPKLGPVDVAVLEDSANDDQITASIIAGSRAAMSDFRTLQASNNIAPPQTPVNMEDLRKAIQARATAGPKISGSFGAQPGWCMVANGLSAGVCQATNVSQAGVSTYLADLIVFALNPPNPRTAGNEIRFPWLLNPRLTVLIPDKELTAQKDLEMSLTVYKLNADGSRTPTRSFENAHHLSHEDLTVGARQYTSTGEYVRGTNVFRGRRIEIYTP